MLVRRRGGIRVCILVVLPADNSDRLGESEAPVDFLLTAPSHDALLLARLRLDHGAGPCQESFVVGAHQLFASIH